MLHYFTLPCVHGPSRAAMHGHGIFDAASGEKRTSGHWTTGLIVLHVIRCLQTLCTSRAAALRLLRAKGSGQSIFLIILVAKPVYLYARGSNLGY